MKVLEKMGWPYWVISLIMGVIVPLVLTWLEINPVWRFGGLLVILNGALAIWLGRRIARRHQPGWWLLIWPVWYFIGAFGILPHYTRYFALVYLCLVYLAYGLTATALLQESKD